MASLNLIRCSAGSKCAVNIGRFWVISHMWGQNPWADWPINFSGGTCPRPNDVFQIWWRSVRGFSVGCGSIFSFPTHFDSRPYNTLTLPCERVILSHVWYLRDRCIWGFSGSGYRMTPDKFYCDQSPLPWQRNLGQNLQ